MTSLKRFLFALFLAIYAMPAQTEGRVDLALVLASDISFSVGPYELDLQRRGYVNALGSPRVISAITSGRHGQIAIAYLEWGDAKTQRLILPWTIIDGPQAARAAADALQTAPLRRSGETSISQALIAATALFSSAPPASHWVIDISADGYNTTGAPVTKARDQALWHGITINGLPISTDEAPKLTDYFRDCVIGGPGAFLVAIDNPADFARALEQKLMLEIASPNAPLYRTFAANSIDCQIGEQNVGEDYNRQLDDITNGQSERWRWPKDAGE